MTNLNPAYYDCEFAHKIREFAKTAKKGDSFTFKADDSPWFDKGHAEAEVWVGAKGGLACNIIGLDDLKNILAYTIKGR